MSICLVEITLIAFDEDGLLPQLMRELDALGLMYRRCIKNYEYDDRVNLTLVCNQSSALDEELINQSLEEIANVSAVVSIIEVEAGSEKSAVKEVTDVESHTELHPLRAFDLITDDVLHIVQDRLSEAYGPTLDILISMAVKKSESVGELFLTLSQDLAENKKESFLRDIEDLEYMPEKIS